MEQVIENQNEIGFYQKFGIILSSSKFLEQPFWKLQQDLEIMLELKQ